MFQIVTAKSLEQTPTDQDPDFLKYLRQEADCTAGGGDNNGSICDEEAKACIKNAQEELNAFISQRGREFVWNYKDGSTNKFKMTEAVVDDKMTQQETADYFKMKAVKYWYQFLAIASWVKPKIVNKVLTSDFPDALPELRSLYSKANDYIDVAENLSVLENRNLNASA